MPPPSLLSDETKFHARKNNFITQDYHIRYSCREKRTKLEIIETMPYL